MKKSNAWILILVILFLIALIFSFGSLTLSQSLKFIYGGLFVLFLPGYVITELFSKKEWILEKIVMSFVLSIATVSLGFFLLIKLFGMKITPITSIISILGIIVIAFLIKYRKRLKP